MDPSFLKHFLSALRQWKYFTTFERNEFFYKNLREHEKSYPNTQATNLVKFELVKLGFYITLDRFFPHFPKRGSGGSSFRILKMKTFFK